MLYAWFFCTGLLTAMTDIGTQILTRRAYGSKAGPWLTCNTFMFATAGLLAPLVDYATDTLYQQCCVYGTVSLLPPSPLPPHTHGLAAQLSTVSFPVCRVWSVDSPLADSARCSCPLRLPS
eukprot:SAG31_NODE_1432_length_8373_cov_8.838289_11_plen_121_part_00